MNRFGQLEKKSNNGGAEGGAKKKKTNIIIVDEDMQRQATPAMRGFKEVLDKKTAKKQREAQQVVPEAPAPAAIGARPAIPQAPPKQQQSSKKRGPPGAVLLDESAERAERKAVAALRRHEAKLKGAAAREDAVVEVPVVQPKPVVQDNSAANSKAVRVTASVSEEPKPQRHADPVALQHQPQQQQRQQQQRPNPKQSRPQQKQPLVPPVPDAASLLRAEALRSATTHVAKGVPTALVKYIFIFQNGKQFTVDGGITAEVLSKEILSRRAVKGGYLVVVEGKNWSDINTIDEPWMSATYLKPLAMLLTKEKKEVSAFPYWPVVTGPRKNAEDAAEAEVRMRLAGDDALELEHIDHGCASKVQVRCARVAFRPFVEALLEQTRLVVPIIIAARELVMASGAPDAESLAMKLPSKLPVLVEELQEALVAHQ